MGASGWEYYVPYEADMSIAFQKLRESIYPEVAKEYPTRVEQIADLENELQRLDSMYPLSKQDFDQAERRQSHEDYIVDRLKRLRSLPEPVTIQERIKELRLICGEDGTGTILDMKQISAKPGYSEVAPLTNQELVNLFGTVQPTRDMIEANKRTIFGLRPSQMGSYVILYANDEPSEIYFVGFSGD
jgi:hypothetical protein